ncbi:YceI family protein [Egicoccus halophilus]|uniref:Polyisoprenoid-binding protein n=1 Tax=Egicoccus halophilus TaxID=1670830 RepID=A0A8J3ESV9_9ACTN|nr:YceI family protein [Egicoccus halophilus]GGI08262.1 polyisoprenoid-binding protein [Egicoccus halophilus]
MSATTALSELTGTYTIDPSHSQVGFVARHAMVTKVRGAFNDFVGSFTIDADTPSNSTAELTIQAASIDTRNEDRDTHLRSNDFFVMEQFPELTFVSTGIERVGDTDYRVTGDLTLRGVTKPVTIELEYTGSAVDPWGNTRVGFEGSTVVNRKDWGVNWNAALDAGGVLVGEKVTLEFEISATKNA